MEDGCNLHKFDWIESEKERRRWVKFVRAETESRVRGHFDDSAYARPCIGNRSSSNHWLQMLHQRLAMNLTSKHGDRLEGNSFLLE